MDISEKLRRMREQRGMSMQELARQSGVPASNISRIENNEGISPSLDTIEKLSLALGISPTYFLNEAARTLLDIDELVSGLPEDTVKFITDQKSMPYLILAEKAMKQGLSPSVIEKLMAIIADEKKQRTE